MDVGWMTIGHAASRLGVKTWELRRLYTSGVLPEPGRIGVYRVVKEADLPVIERALREAGYLKDGTKAEA